jgi:hypothetical protein
MPDLSQTFVQVIDMYTAGDPMQDGVHWTNLTRVEIAAALEQEGFSVSTTVVNQLLDEHGFRDRHPRKAKTMGETQNRDAQFRKIAALKAEYLAAGQPVLSIDTKKHEMLGHYVRPGRVLSTAPLEGWDHDFPTYSPGVAIPFGLYDEQFNEGYVYLGTSHDTSHFAVDAIKNWFTHYGQRRYPGAKQLLLLCDSGGSTSCRRLVFKEQLYRLAERTGLEIRVAHYPTYCSKYNPIEHRLFPHLTRVCRGVFLETLEMLRDLLRTASTRTGLHVNVNILQGIYETGLAATDDFIQRMPVRFDGFLPDWNYTLAPTS